VTEKDRARAWNDSEGVGQTGKSERETYGACQASSSSDTIIVHVAAHLYFLCGFFGGVQVQGSLQIRQVLRIYIYMHATLRKHTTYG
jgi:hypothetical protein